jgi:hypothetical protein
VRGWLTPRKEYGERNNGAGCRFSAAPNDYVVEMKE